MDNPLDLAYEALLSEAKLTLTELRDLRASIRHERRTTPHWLRNRIDALSAAIKACEGGAP
jgi:hypothetical protein